MKQCLPDTAGV